MAINIAINGAAGRMGRCLIQAVAETDGLQLSAAIDRAVWMPVNWLESVN